MAKAKTPDVGRTFDRLIQFDEKSLGWPVRALVGAKPWRSYTWNGAPHLDQGVEGECVGFAWAHELAARPAALKVTKRTARALYSTAQKNDGYPDDQPGTTILAGAKAVQARGHINHYRWAFTLDDTVLAVGYAGPVVAGLWWHEGMVDPDEDGFIRPTGVKVGGHAVMIKAVNVKDRRFTVHNSWGASWGMGGDAYLSFDDFDQLLHDDGEVCVPLQRTTIGDSDE